MKSIVAILTLLLIIQASTSQAQYRVHQWMNFEEGTIPTNVTIGHQADQSTVSLFSHNRSQLSLNDMTPMQKRELGEVGLSFTPDETKRHLSVVDSVTLNRERLGSAGRALFQADIYLPPPGEPIPNISLLAVSPGESKTSRSYEFYRFGLMADGERIFFSATERGNSSPIIFHQQSAEEMNLSRPGWHRFQIIFIGPDTIVCAVDGRQTDYSPFKDTTHSQLAAGMMVTVGQEGAVGYVDNLSIQWTGNDIPLPVSPWAADQFELASGTGLGPFTGGLVWMDDTAAAWTQASRVNKPVLALFYAPKVRPYQYLMDIAPDNAAAIAPFGGYVPLRIDMNQLNGGLIADRFKVFRVPTLVVVQPSGAITKSLVVEQGTTQWDDVVKFLNE